MQKYLVEIENLTFNRGERNIFNNLNLRIEQGKVTAIMGPSGIGKTTLLKLIVGQLQADSGKILFDGVNLGELSRHNLYKIRKRMGMLFQSGALFTDMSSFDNVAFPLREHTTLPEELIRQLVLMKLETVGLRGASELMPSELSGGMARRVALARTIALDPELLLFDEPFTGQDPISMGVIVSLIRKLNTTLGLTSIVVSHDVEEVLSIADYAYIVAEHQVIAEGEPQALLQSKDPRVIQFLEGNEDGPTKFQYPAEDYLQELFD